MSSNKELQTKIAELEAQLAEMATAKTAAEQKATELEAKAAAAPTSKGRREAQQALALLEKGTVTLAQLAEINPKYPSDPIYYVRTLLKVDVKTTKAKGGKTTYALVPATPVVVAPAQTDAPAAEQPVEPVIEAAVIEAEAPAAVEELAAV